MNMVESYIIKNMDKIATLFAKHIKVHVEHKNSVLTFQTKVGNTVVAEESINIGEIIDDHFENNYELTKED